MKVVFFKKKVNDFKNSQKFFKIDYTRTNVAIKTDNE